MGRGAGGTYSGTFHDPPGNFQITAAPSPPAVGTVRPSAAKSTANATLPGWAGTSYASRQVPVSHTLTSPLAWAEIANHFPSAHSDTPQASMAAPRVLTTVFDLRSKTRAAVSPIWATIRAGDGARARETAARLRPLFTPFGADKEGFANDTCRR